MEEKKLVFRNLHPYEIQVRPTDTKTKGSCTLLLFKDARSDMDILDETVGAENWQREYYEVKGNVYCRIGIKFGDEWVWKSDCGVESNIDAAKGEASDASKRAAVAWGIGRELYSGPRIKLTNLPDKYYYNDHLSMSFYVKDIRYEGKTITELVIADKWENIVFNWSIYDGRRDKQEKPQSSLPQPTDNLSVLREYCKMRIKEEPDNKDEITKFGTYYADKLPTWQGPFQINRLYNSWMNKRRS